MAIKLANTTEVLEIIDVGNFDICIADPRMLRDYEEMQKELAATDLQNITPDDYVALSERAQQLIASSLVDKDAIEKIFHGRHDIMNEVIVMTEIVRLFESSEALESMEAAAKELESYAADLLPEK